MSLKFFHIFFISLSVALAFGFAVWLFRSYTEGGRGVVLAAAIISAAAGASLIVYARRFLKKLKHVRYL